MPQENDAATPAAPLRFEADALDEGLDINNLPPPPWTREKLGAETFDKLATVGGYGDLRLQQNPSLDPRSFGKGRAVRMIEAYGLAGDEAAAFLVEGQAIQERINAGLPPSAGTPRAPKMPQLKPATVTERRRTF